MCFVDMVAGGWRCDCRRCPCGVCSLHVVIFDLVVIATDVADVSFVFIGDIWMSMSWRCDVVVSERLVIGVVMAGEHAPGAHGATD